MRFGISEIVKEGLGKVVETIKELSKEGFERCRRFMEGTVAEKWSQIGEAVSEITEKIEKGWGKLKRAFEAVYDSTPTIGEVVDAVTKIGKFVEDCLSGEIDVEPRDWIPIALGLVGTAGMMLTGQWVEAAVLFGQTAHALHNLAEKYDLAEYEMPAWFVNQTAALQVATGDNGQPTLKGFPELPSSDSEEFREASRAWHRRFEESADD